jgi:hypothetical protein
VGHIANKINFKAEITLANVSLRDFKVIQGYLYLNSKQRSQRLIVACVRDAESEVVRC